MAQVITIAGERLFALKAQNNEQLDVDTFIFANVPGQDPTTPIDRNEGLPPVGQIVHQQIVQQVGRVNDNVVIYSTVMDSLTGPFDFNWVGLYSSVNQTLIAVSHIPSVSKTITVPGAAGNTLNRNFGIEYSGIADLTGITVAPETWQLDFTARLSGMDELTRQLASDMNGKDWFIDDGFKVIPRSTANTFNVTAGAGYVSGLRVELKQDHILTLQSYPQFVYVDAWFDGDASSQWSPKTAFTVTNGEMDDYIDVNGKPHYVFKLAEITSAFNVRDARNVDGIRQKINNFEAKVDGVLTSFYDLKASIFDGDINPSDSYTAWPYGCLFNDLISDTEYVIQCYTSGSGHVASNKKAYSRRKKVGSESWGSRVLIGGNDNLGVTVHAAGKIQNGDYIAIARVGEYFPEYFTNLYRSVDKGITWELDYTLGTSNSGLNPVEAGSIFITKLGTVLSFGRESQALVDKTYILRNTNVSASKEGWEKIPLDTLGINPLEGAFVQVKDGTIICVARLTVGGPVYDNKEGAVFFKSEDDGVSWSQIKWTNIDDMTSNPAAMIYDCDSDTVEIFYGSRYNNGDNKSSIYQAISSSEDIKNGIFSKIRRMSFGVSSRDFGYPAAVRLDDGRVLLTFYSGKGITTRINEMEGSKLESTIKSNNTKGIVNRVTGFEHSFYDVSDAGDEQVALKGVIGVFHPGVVIENTPVKFLNEYLFPDTMKTVLFGPVAPTSNIILDVKSALKANGLWNEYIGGVVLEIVYSSNINDECEINIGSTVVKKRIVVYGNQNTFKSSQCLNVPLNADGTLEVNFNYPSRVSQVYCAVKGYISKNIII